MSKEKKETKELRKEELLLDETLLTQVVGGVGSTSKNTSTGMAINVVIKRNNKR